MHSSLLSILALSSLWLSIAWGAEAKERWGALRSAVRAGRAHELAAAPESQTHWGALRSAVKTGKGPALGMAGAQPRGNARIPLDLLKAQPGAPKVPKRKAPEAPEAPEAFGKGFGLPAKPGAPEPFGEGWLGSLPVQLQQPPMPEPQWGHPMKSGFEYESPQWRPRTPESPLIGEGFGRRTKPKRGGLYAHHVEHPEGAAGEYYSDVPPPLWRSAGEPEVVGGRRLPGTPRAPEWQRIPEWEWEPTPEWMQPMPEKHWGEWSPRKSEFRTPRSRFTPQREESATFDEGSPGYVSAEESVGTEGYIPEMHGGRSPRESEVATPRSEFAPEREESLGTIPGMYEAPMQRAQSEPIPRTQGQQTPKGRERYPPWEDL